MRSIMGQREQIGMLSPWGVRCAEASAADPTQSLVTPEHIAQVEKILDDYRKRGVDSRSMYGIVAKDKAQTTHYGPKRRGQQLALLKQLYQEWGANVPSEGKALFMGGLGGSGKGFVQKQADSRIDKSRYMTIDPDAIKVEMAKRGMIPHVDGLSPMETSPLVHEEASNLAQELARMARNHKRNLIWDITMASDKSVQSRINDLRKAGYGQVDGAFVDADPETARHRVINRYKDQEEPYRRTGEGFGGRIVPESVSKGNLPTPGSGFLSKNAEVFDRIHPQFDNAAIFDARGAKPVRRNVKGTHWADAEQQAPSILGPQAPPSAAPPPPAPPQSMLGPQQPRAAAWTIRSAAMPEATPEPAPDSVRGLVHAFKHKQIDYPTLAHGVLNRPTDPDHDGVGDAGDWSDNYHRADDEPGDNDPFWVRQAAHDGAMTHEQAEQIYQAIDKQVGLR